MQAKPDFGAIRRRWQFVAMAPDRPASPELYAQYLEDMEALRAEKRRLMAILAARKEQP